MLQRFSSDTAPLKPGTLWRQTSLQHCVNLAVTRAVVPLRIGEIRRLLAVLFLDDLQRQLRLDAPWARSPWQAAHVAS